MALAAENVKKLRSALKIGAVVALVAAAVHAAGVVLEPFELRLHDVRTRFTLPRQGGHPDVSLVIITDESLEWMEATNAVSWPWDREAYAYIIRACGKATAVLFDLFVNDPGPGEKVFAEALAKGPPAYLATQFRFRERQRKPQARPDEEALLRKFAVEVVSDGSVSLAELYKEVFLPRPVIAAAAAGLCDVSTPRDSDGGIRRYRLLSKFKDRYYPSFALAALMAREQTRRVEIRGRTLTVGRLSFPVERDGSIHLRYYAPGTTFALDPASRVIGGLADLEGGGKVTTFDPASVERKVVIFGATAAGLLDLRITPVTDLMPGSEVHATAIANLLNLDYVRAAPAWVAYVLIVLAAFGMAVVTRFATPLAGGAAGLAFFAGFAGVNILLWRARWSVDLSPQLLAVVVSYASASTINFLYEGRQRLRVKREFQRYLSPKVVEKILRNPTALHMEGERKVLSIFFMDFAGFTSLSETLDPAELVKLISEYHHEAADEIFKTEGTLDKFIGDAIMAFWNDPIDQPDHALRACRAAVAAQRRLRELAAAMRERGLPEMQARIGVNSGLATVGNMGARGQFNYTAIGDEVNLASRLEGVNKEFGTEIIVSEATYLPAKDAVEVRELALIKVKGKKHPVRIYELLGLKGEVAPERLQAVRSFERALTDLRARRFAEAGEGFAALDGKDKAAALYRGLARRYAAEPPPADWDGSYKMESK